MNRYKEEMHTWKFIAFLLLWPLTSFGQTEETIRVGLAHEPPFVIRQGQDYAGLSVDLWRKMAAQKGVDYEMVPYYDHLGLMRALDFEEIDIAINPIHVSEVRVSLLEASPSFYVSAIGVATSQVESSQLGLVLRTFFSLEFLRLLLFLGLAIFVFGTILWLVERKQNRRQFRPSLKGLFDGFWWSAVTMTTVGYGDKAPKTRLGRIVAMTWMFTAIVLISGFTATIASTLTVSSLSRTIEDLEDMRHTANIGSVIGSSSEDFLRRNQVASPFLYPDAEKALLALAAGEIEVLVYDKTILDYLIGRLQLTNKVSLLPVSFNKQYRSFFLPKNSELRTWVYPLLARQINEPSWQELLEKYNLRKEE
jgi:polar amino acid transport system substrate-binding protein